MAIGVSTLRIFCAFLFSVRGCGGSTEAAGGPAGADVGWRKPGRNRSSFLGAFVSIFFIFRHILDHPSVSATRMNENYNTLLKASAGSQL